MTPARHVQFKDIESVLDAYTNWDIPAFAIWCGKQFQFRYCEKSMTDGKAFLANWLQMLYDNGAGSAAIYTLCVYEDLPDDGKIKSNTAYDGSFNFRLNEYPSGYVQGQPGGMNALVSEINALKKKLAEKEEEEEEDNTYGLGKLGLILQHPAIEPLVPALTNKVMDWVLNEDKTPAKVTRISGITMPDNMPKDPQEILKQALDILYKEDPEFEKTLWKIARMSISQPKKFKIYMQTFKLMTV